MAFYRSLRIFLLLSAIQRDFADGYATGGLIWDRDHRSFVPIANVSTFEAYRQELLDKSRELENHNFQMHPIRLAYIEENNVLHFYDNDTKITGVCGEIWNMLADYANFTLVIIKTDSFGVVLPNKSISGIFGMIIRKEIDVVPRVAVFPAFSRVMDYTMPIWKDRYRFYIRFEFTAPIAWVFLLFKPQVWCSIIAVVLLLSGFGYWMHKLSIKEFADMNVRHTLHDYLFQTLATLCSQGSVPETMYRRNRILALSKTIFAWLIMINLNSNLVSWLANREMRPPFSNIETLLNNTKYDMVVANGSMVFYPLKLMLKQLVNPAEWNATGPAVKYENRLFYVGTNEELYQTGCWGKGHHAVFESEDAYQACGRYFCELESAGKHYFSTWVTFGVVKNFTHKRALDIGILKFKQFGLISGMKKRWIRSPADTRGPKRQTFSTVHIMQVVMIFTILCIGMSISVLIFIIELIVFTYKFNRRKNLRRKMQIW